MVFGVQTMSGSRLWRSDPDKKENEMTWTRFMDMHSGGGQKHDFATIYIEAPEAEAKAVFYARFGINPERVTCTCRGEDYSVEESPTLEEATAYSRNLRYITPEWAADWYALPVDMRRKANELSRTLEVGEEIPDGFVFDNTVPSLHREEPIAMADFLPTLTLIRADEITAEERAAVVPDQGYVWVD